MKLRIQGNALRLRLNQAEVAQFSKTGFFEDSVEFSPGVRLTYALESCSSVRSPQALYRDGSLRIQVPYQVGFEWATTDRTGISGGEHLAITVEKDFQCLHGDSARDPNAFPNPLEEAAAGHKME
ncbi:MAG TPA: hypothetical protein VK776_01525 [Bryobacteraceae bacterium]|jgi:hypothetical protein|nr:hypothetical protein [Bryobacteraceae bacterium]